MTHHNFTQRPDYHQHISCYDLRCKAAQDSRAGHYNLATLWAFRKVWQQSAKGHDYLAYLCFRRALGYPLTARKAAQLQQLLQRVLPLRLWHKLYGHRLRQCHNLLAEYHYQRGQPVSGAAVAAPYRLQVQYWRSQQSLWLNQLAHFLQQANRVQLVGNSPKLAGSNSGADIDAADIVIRFNRYHSAHTLSMDSGSKCSVWVMAPDFRGSPPPGLTWCLVSGPDMLWWQQRWPQIKDTHNIKLLSIPLTHWRYLVRQLAAPPSAGLLVTHFITGLLPEPNSLMLAGFGHDPSAAQYHYAAPEHHAVSRHNWQAEYQLLKQWQHSTTGTPTT